MTVEQQQYGGGWAFCRRCGVKDRVDQLEAKDGAVFHVEKRAAKCAEWALSMAKATPADVDAAAHALSTKKADPHL